jgi:predicted nucleic acid-binding protein
MAINDLPTPLVVCDAGPLIHLDELGCMDLLADFSEVLVPEAVFAEVLKHRPGALDHNALPFRRVRPSAPEPPALEAMAQVLSLHTGERESLRVALEYHPGLLLTDDTAARLAAGNLGIVTHGTIGILVRAIRRRQRTKPEILAMLRALPDQSTLHLKRSLLDAVIHEVEIHA